MSDRRAIYIQLYYSLIKPCERKEKRQTITRFICPKGSSRISLLSSLSSGRVSTGIAASVPSRTRVRQIQFSLSRPGVQRGSKRSVLEAFVSYKAVDSDIFSLRSKFFLIEGTSHRDAPTPSSYSSESLVSRTLNSKEFGPKVKNIRVYCLQIQGLSPVFGSNTTSGNWICKEEGNDKKFMWQNFRTPFQKNYFRQLTLQVLGSFVESRLSHEENRISTVFCDD